VAALILWGIAELLVCLIDIENNTRVRAAPESQPKETQAAAPLVTPVAQPAPTTNSPAECDEIVAAALAARNQNIKDILNKKLW
jgi:hypothetical protein